MPSTDCSGVRRQRGWVMAIGAVVAALFLRADTALAAAQSIDGRFVDVASEAPAFGGMFVDGKELNVYLMDRRRAVRANPGSAIREEFAQRLPRKINVLSARFDFTRLKAWHDRLSADVLGLSGVVLTDIDDAKNRLTVGVENQKTRDWVARQLPSLRIPREAVNIELMAPIKPTSLREYHRPLVGGLQIRYRGFFGFFSNCTVGFNAIRGGESGFVTASHCSKVHSSTDIGCDPAESACIFPSDGTRYAQPVRPSFVGAEAFDPRYFWGGPVGGGNIDGCPPANTCRYSDSMFVGSAVNATRGRIARSNLSYAWNGLDGYRIVAKSDPVVGRFVAKIGRTTGRTTGKVTRTCFNTNTTPTVGGFNVLCQAEALYHSEDGDSGAPVFSLLEEGGRKVTLRGINWGYWDGAAGSVFSPISGVQRSTELGPLTVCASGFAC
jgi:hypothetical protein